MNNNFFKFIIRLMLVIIITLVCLIAFRKNSEFKSFFYDNFFKNNFSFVSVNNYYKKLFGSPIPFSDYFIEKEQTVFSDKLKYKKISNYLDGVELEVDLNYLVPSIDSGMIIFIGDKDNYPNTIIVSLLDGVEVWYSNVTSNVVLYDYIEKGDLIGSSLSDKIYLVFKKNGEIIDYNDYI